MGISPGPFQGQGNFFSFKEKLVMQKKWCTAALAVITLAVVLICSSCLGEAEEAKPNIVKPYISIQPKSASYFTDDYADIENKSLSMEIWDWTRAEGSLRYQWYWFEDIEAYCITRSGTAIPGESGALEGVEDPETGYVIYKTTYTPDIQPEAGKQYFYYVLVTNSNPDAETTSSSTASEIAVISFSNPGDPMIPVISRQPSNATYGWGAEMSPLRVDASLPEGAEGILTYQWYSNSSFSTRGGTAIAQADQSSLLPDFDLLNLGPNYSFVVVTNNVAANEPVRAISLPAVITIQPGRKAAPPRIETQPQDQLYFTGETIVPLRVVATSLDRGSLSYQWYRNTTVSSKGGAAISGARSASYTPTDNSGFYYVVVTNTNNNVTGQKTETTSSKVVKVAIAASATDENPSVFLSIPDPEGEHLESRWIPSAKVVPNKFQYIRGYGGMDVAWGNFPLTRPSDTELMYDPDRLGYNMLRIMIRADNVDPEQTVNDLLNGDRPYYYENVKIVNKYGGYVLASPWTPPKEWKTNNSINGGGTLIPSYYKLFATYLRNFAQLMYDNGAPIYAISISNEPNYVAGYDGCEWDDYKENNPEAEPHMKNFFLEVGHFTDGIRGYGGGKETPYVLTMNGESANTPYINLPALQNPRSKAAIDVLARHVYGEFTKSMWYDYPDLITKSDGSKYEVWMTEHNINSANATGYYNDSTWNYVWRFMNDVDLVIRRNNENAFVWWASKRFYSMIGDGQFGTVGAAEKNEEPTPYPRGWGLSHYARYTIDTTRINVEILAARTGTASTVYDSNGNPVRVETANRAGSKINDMTNNMDNTSVRVTAFVSQDGNEISLVMWTPTLTSGSGGYSMGTVKIDLPPGFEAKSAIAHRSWGQLGNQMFQLDTDDPQGRWKAVRLSPDRTTAYVDVPRSQILSVKFTR
jgi:O-glycosyl hydrolase